MSPCNSDKTFLFGFMNHLCGYAGCALIVLSLLLVAPVTAWSDQITVATGVMTEDQALNNLLFARTFGVDATSPLNFTSFVSPDGLSFSYDLVSGSMYAGQSVSMSAVAIFDILFSTWTTSMSGVFAGQPFITAGKQVEKRNPDDSVTVTSDKDIRDENGHKIRDIHIEVIFTPTGISTGVGYYTMADGSPELNTVIYSLDHQEGQDWVDDASSLSPDIPNSSFALHSSGISPVSGGNGNFTTTVHPVPEPATSVMLLLGLVMILVLVRTASSFAR